MVSHFLKSVAKLDELGLVVRKERADDKRVREAVVTAEGKAMTDPIDAARERIARTTFDSWEEKDIDDLVRLMQKFADSVEDKPDRQQHAGDRPPRACYAPGDGKLSWTTHAPPRQGGHDRAHPRGPAAIASGLSLFRDECSSTQLGSIS